MWLLGLGPLWPKSQAPPLLHGLGWPFLKVESEPPGPSVDARGRDLIYLFIAWPVCSGESGGHVCCPPPAPGFRLNAGTQVLSESGRVGEGEMGGGMCFSWWWWDVTLRGKGPDAHSCCRGRVWGRGGSQPTPCCPRVTAHPLTPLPSWRFWPAHVCAVDTVSSRSIRPDS